MHAQWGAYRASVAGCLSCDVCGDGWVGDAGQPHFDTREALELYAAKAGWIVTPLRAVCPSCTPDEACAVGGHEWGRWKSAGPFPRPVWRVLGKSLICDRWNRAGVGRV